MLLKAVVLNKNNIQHGQNKLVANHVIKDKNKDQQGKDNVHRTQPPTHQSRAPRRHQTNIRAVKGKGHVMCEIKM
jgi:hypothetical protein